MILNFEFVRVSVLYEIHFTARTPPYRRSSSLLGHIYPLPQRQQGSRSASHSSQRRILQRLSKYPRFPSGGSGWGPRPHIRIQWRPWATHGPGFLPRRTWRNPWRAPHRTLYSDDPLSVFRSFTSRPRRERDYETGRDPGADTPQDAQL
jgi:hypothetical protein